MILIVIPVIIALLISYVFFDNNFNYTMYFTMIFMLILIGMGVIDFYFFAIVVLIFSIMFYLSIAPKIKERNEGGSD